MGPVSLQHHAQTRQHHLQAQVQGIFAVQDLDQLHHFRLQGVQGLQFVLSGLLLNHVKADLQAGFAALVLDQLLLHLIGALQALVELAAGQRPGRFQVRGIAEAAGLLQAVDRLMAGLPLIVLHMEKIHGRLIHVQQLMGLRIRNEDRLTDQIQYVPVLQFRHILPLWISPMLRSIVRRTGIHLYLFLVNQNRL